MELHLTRWGTTRTVLVASAPNAPPTPLYHIHTPGAFSRKNTTICRIHPSIAHDPRYKLTSDRWGEIVDHKELGPGLDEIARIEWHSWSSSKLVYGGEILKMNKFMPRGGLLWTDRTFVGPDGLSYTWHTGMHLTLKVKKDGEKYEVAKYHEGITSKPYIEVLPAGMHILDLIVITWVFAATEKKDEEQSSAAAQAAHGAQMTQTAADLS
ncbi:hypothetical protein EIP91_003636 [Steccherinum ochraceum]|uniref:DUF6593 domain-containing protein n=1 Tax=Steccherinum ochraceum TaxID=92696 RepID=A0A4R0RCN6_9APHY|nr:hypothetical protein EIP91_003636 [Steccherinum ochraceum]